MKPRVCSDPRTEPFPAAAVAAWARLHSKDNPASGRLISLGLGAMSLWLLAQVLAMAWPTLFSRSGAQVLKAEDIRVSAAPAPRAALLENPAPRATLVEKPAPRALPVYLSGDSFRAHLPDGRVVNAVERGSVPSFSSLPLHPALGDHYTVTEGGAHEGVSWIWATPLGWNHPAWIDP